MTAPDRSEIPDGLSAAEWVRYLRDTHMPREMERFSALLDEAVGGEGPEQKTLMTTSAGWASPALRIDRVPMSIVEPTFVSDLLPQITPAGSSGSIRFMRETSATNATAPLAEGGTKPESTLVAAEVALPLVKVAGVMQATEEVLEDDPNGEAYVNARMRLFVKEALDLQIVRGNGTAPNMAGFLGQTPPIQTVAAGSAAVDSIATAIANVRINGHIAPDAVLLNPANFAALATAKTAGGNLYTGSPLGFAPVPTVWGVPLIQTTATPAGTALVGAFGSMAALATKGGITIERSEDHLDFFTKNLIMLRAEVRAVLCVFRPAAFCSVTGLT